MSAGSVLLSSRVWIEAIIQSAQKSQQHAPLPLADIGYSLLRLLLVSGLMAALGGFQGNLSATDISPLTSPLLTINLCLISILFLSREFQQELIPSCLPLLHNPLKCIPRKKSSLTISITTDFLGVLHMMTRHILPIFLTGWIVVSVIGKPYGGMSSLIASLTGMDAGYHFWTILLAIRAFRLAWDRTDLFGWDVYIICIINSLSDGSCINQPSSLDWWCQCDILKRLLIVGVCREILTRISNQSWFWILSLKHFLFNRKQRVEGWYFYLVPILIISPVTIVISSILDAPALPILGLPLLWMGFPRPKRMWPIVGMHQ